MDLFSEVAARRSTASLFTELRDAIESGRLRAGDRLPPSRHVAQELGIARQTVTTVYGRLVAEGWVEGRAGGGTVVRTVPTATARRRPRGTGVIRPVTPPSLSATPPADGPGALLDLRPGRPDPMLFPLVAWRRAMTSAMQRVPPSFGDPCGEMSLRRAIAHWVGRSRGVDAAPEQVVVASGAQQAMDLVARLLLRRGDHVAVEDPGYAPFRDLLELHGARVHGVPVDADGLVPDHLPPNVRLIVTTPSHQSPTAVTMTLDRRRALLAFATRHDAAIVEDDYDSEYRHVDRPLEPLQRLDTSGRVIYVGTLSKVLSPSLRLGYAVLPPSLVGAAATVRALMDSHPPFATQLALELFINGGELDRHLRRVRKTYSARHAIVQRFVEDAAAAGLVDPTSRSQAGLHVMARLPQHIDEAEVRRRCLDGGVAVGSLAECWAERPSFGGLVIGFGAASTADLPLALRTVRAVLEAVRQEG